MMKRTKIYLAPMASAADGAMRRICFEHGADGVTTEMISARAVYYNDKKTFELAAISKEEGPCALQIFGHEPDIMAHAVKVLYDKAEVKPSSFDINMGCPVKKIVSNGEGSALMRDPLLASKIISAVVSASVVPVTVKIRAGWDRQHKNAPEFAKIAEECGASSVCVHGRTREDMYISGTVDYGVIAEVKQAVKIPVIANGDIVDGKTASDALEITGADGLAVARAALGNPFVFEEIKAYLNGEEYSPPDTANRLDAALKHLYLLAELKGERTAVLEARKHMAYYTKGMTGSAVFRQKINAASNMAEMIELLNQIKRGNIE